jgi:hypothetical protein
MHSLEFKSIVKRIYLNSSRAHVPKKLPQSGPHLTLGEKKAIINHAVKEDEFVEIVRTTVRPNGSVYVGRGSQGEGAIVIVLGARDSRLHSVSPGLDQKAGSR